MENVIDLLQERGLVDALSSEDVRDLARRPLKIYCGFDPTSDSLHLGNLVSLMGLAWFQRCGHTPVALIGGATGMIGDPSGRSTERSLLDEETIRHNAAGIEKNIRQVLDFGDVDNAAIVVNNYDWFGNFSLVEFLRDVGKRFRVGPMLAKESVRARMKSDEGMSFTEFTYQLLQGYDFLHLYDNYGVTMQLGGSDQWGNITGGIDFVRKMRSKPVYGVTFPLMMSSTGQKFGKSQKGAISLSGDKLSPYEFYQYLVRIPDADVIGLLRMLTFLAEGEIKKYEEQLKLPDAEPNLAQKRLAEEVTRLIHGEEKLAEAMRVTAGVSPGAETELNGAALEALADQMPTFEVQKESLVGQPLLELVVSLGLRSSKGEVRRLIRNGGVYLNNERVEEENFAIELSDLIDGKLLLLSLGKKNKVIVRTV